MDRFWGGVGGNINYVLPVTNLSNSASSHLKVSLYMDTVSHVGSVKYIPLSFRHSHPKYQVLGLPRIQLEQKIAQTDFFFKHIYYDSLDEKVIIITLEQMKIYVGSVMIVLPLRYGKYGVLVTKILISRLLEGIWR